MLSQETAAQIPQIQFWPIDRFVFYARNPRKNDAAVDRMCASIREFGFKIPVLARSDGTVVDGHLRLKSARKLGSWPGGDTSAIPVILCDEWTPAQVKAFRLLVNRSVAWADWDEELLALEIQELRDADYDLSLTGFEDEELARLIAEQDATEGLTDEDAVPDLPQTPVSAAGDLWILGNHTLFVGDATNETDVTRLMAGEAVDLVFSDPPFNVDYTGYTEDRLKIQNDQMSAEEFKRFLHDSFRSFRRIVKPGASLYVCHSSSWQREFQNALESAGFEIRCQIIWAKNTFAWGFGRYKFQHEPMFYCHVAGQKDPWYGDKSQSTLWEEKKPAANRLHPTMKPVELVERALVNSSKAGDVVVDLFAGSGSTLIGCERRGRKARLMEIDPRYADVAITRWQRYSGQKATLKSDGRVFEEISTERLQEAT
ncbi:MAG TPA: DNA modification methylase [Bryobacteraceae bacterium]|nr:DNA modification methylase [Bryobacteraceae bacterium]